MIVKMKRTQMVLQRMTPLLRFYHHQEVFQWLRFIKKKMPQFWQRLNQLKVGRLDLLQKKYKKSLNKNKKIK